MLRLDGKVAFVSGAGSVGEGWGNGKATAVLLARQGAKVYGTDIREEAVAETRGIIRQEGGTCETRTCDMTNSADVAATVADCVAKFGILAFTKSTAMSFAKKGIRCNTVIPGLMHTPLVEHRLVKQLSPDDAASLIAKRHASVPMGRMGDAWDVAHAILFLVSEEARYITGTEIIVDGGMSAAGTV